MKDNFFDDIFGKAFGNYNNSNYGNYNYKETELNKTNIDLLYKTAKNVNNSIKLYKMKSGSFKILNIITKEVIEEFNNIHEAKLEFVTLTMQG